MKSSCGIYEIQCLANGKAYIGSSVNIRRRLRVHIWALKTGRHENPKLQSAWDKYGADAFSTRTILLCEPAMRLFYEQRAIDSFRSVAEGLNLACNVSSPMLGVGHTLESRRKIAAAAKGRAVSEETRAQLRALALERSDATSEQMKYVWLLRPKDFHARIAAVNKGKKRSIAVRERMAIANKATWANPEYRAKQLLRLAKARAAAGTQEARAKMSASQKARYENDPLERERVGARSRGTKRSPETKERMRLAAIAREARKREAAKS